MRDLDRLKKIIKEEYKTDWCNLDDSSLYGFNQITKENSGLPVDIEIDNAKIYEYTQTPLALYFRNSYLKEEEWLPIDYRYPFRLLFESKELNITLSDYYKLCIFVNKNHEKLTKLTEGKYDYMTFLKVFDKHSLNESLIVSEMANVPQDITGLKHLLWIDPGETHKKGGHWLRIKVRTPNGDTTLKIPSLEWVGGEILPSGDRKNIEKYVKINIDKLTNVLMGQMSLHDYYAVSTKVDSKGLPISKFNVKQWLLFGTLENNIKIYKQNKLPVKYFITNDDKTSLFKSEDEQTILFDNISEIDENGKFCLAKIGSEKYMITSSGKLIDLKTIYNNF